MVFERAPRPERLPVVLTQGEVKRLLAAVPVPCQLPVRLLYGSGLRLMECLRLRIKDVDVPRRQITVRGGKGDKDRVRNTAGAGAKTFNVELSTFNFQVGAGGGAQAGGEDAHQFIGFINQGLNELGFEEWNSLHELQPPARFPKFLVADFHLMNEITPRFCSLSFAVVRQR